MSASAVRVHALGDFRVLVHGRTLFSNSWGRTPARQLFKYLITFPRRRLLREEAIELLWPEDEQMLGRGADLRSALAALRRALDPVDLVDANRESVGLAAGADLWVDADAFTELLQSARTASDPYPTLLQANALYRGDYLPEDVFEDWVRDRREQLKRAWIELQFNIARLAQERGDSGAALEVLENLVRADSCDERAAGELMRVLFAQGRRSEALRAYDRLLRALKDELDVEPSDDILRVRQQIAADDAPQRGLPAVSLPTGLVTFLSTQVQDSARLWDRYPTLLRHAIGRHDEIVTALVSRHRGHVVRFDRARESRLAVFAASTDAVAAAAEIQRALHHEVWQVPEPIRVQLALHTGEAELADGDYYGGAVNRCTCLCQLGHPGQLLVSGATYDLVSDADGWPRGASPRWMGEHHLPGLARPERVFQIDVDGVRSDFPRLRSESDNLPDTLPATLDSFIGRKSEMTWLEDRILNPNIRLITITGPGGVGKTRLAVEFASRAAQHFEDGVVFVSLAAASDTEGVLHAIAQVLTIHPHREKTLARQIAEHLATRRALLVLDNFEQVVEASPVVVELLAACRHVKALVTSREVLSVRGEHALAVAPLDLDARDDSTLDESMPAAAQLFMDRAAAVLGAAPSGTRATEVVVEICRRLDGLPLAIELVAARTRHLPLELLNAHLQEHSLLETSAGPRDAPNRHRTLQRAIDWSYQLLNAQQQSLFRELSVFAGGCTLEAAEAVCRMDEFADGVAGGLEALVDKSLVRRRQGGVGEIRFEMLETIRQFAAEQLVASAEESGIRDRHAEYCLTLVEQATGARFGPDEAQWMLRLQAEYENLRGAWRWVLDQRRVSAAMRMGSVLAAFWVSHGYTADVLRGLDEVVDMCAGEDTRDRVRLLIEVGALAQQLGRIAMAVDVLEEALAIAERLGDRALHTRALGGLAFVVHERGQHDYAVELARATVKQAFELDDRSVQARALARLAELLARNGSAEESAQMAESAVSAATEAGDQVCIGAALDTLGLAERLLGNADGAVRALERALPIDRSMGWRANTASALLRWADAELACDDVDRAWRLCRAGLEIARDASSTGRLVVGLRIAASIAARKGVQEDAVRLCAAAERVASRSGACLWPIEQRARDALMKAAADSLGMDRYLDIREQSSDELVEDVLAALLATGSLPHQSVVTRQQAGRL